MTARLWHSPGYPEPRELIATVEVPPSPHAPDYVLWQGRLFRCLFESYERGAEYGEVAVHKVS